MKAIGIIGYHHTGKTALATAIIRELTSLGYSVVSLKDIHSDKFYADTPGKNTSLHAQAGSKAVFAKGLHDSALLFPRSLELKEIVPLLKADFLIIEGLKTAPVPKLVCGQSSQQLDELIDGTTIGISGMIADDITEYRGLPVFCLQKQLPALMDTILSKSFPLLPLSDPECCAACGKSCYQMAEDIVQGKAKRSDCVLDNAPKLSLSVDGDGVVMVPFVQKLLHDSVLSFVDNLKGINPTGEITLTIKR